MRKHHVTLVVLSALLAGTWIGSCALVGEPAPQSVETQAELDALNARLDEIAAAMRNAGSAAATGNLPGATIEVVGIGAKIKDVMSDFDLDFTDVIAGAVLALLGVRKWRGPADKADKLLKATAKKRAAAVAKASQPTKEP